MNRAIKSVVLTLFAACSMGEKASAQSLLHVWGVARDCKPLLQANRQAERQLQTPTQRVGLLQSRTGKGMPACQGERCGRLLRSACPGLLGRVLGGQVVQGRDSVQYRLWLYDVQTGQLAVQDDYAQSLAIEETFVAQARALLANPRFGAALPGPKPMYCAKTSPDPSAAAALGQGPLFWMVFGEGKHKAALSDAVEKQLDLLGKKPQPLPFDPRTDWKDTLAKRSAGAVQARLLGIEVKKDGAVRLFLYDQKTQLVADQDVHCPACDKDGSDKLIERIKQDIPTLLEHCFGYQCADSGLPVPIEACASFAATSCEGLGDLLTLPSTTPPTRYIDPTTAKWVKGGLWGLFAASASTAIGLGVANATEAGVISDRGGRVEDALARPAWLAVGVSAALLAVALPTTIVLKRAEQAVWPVGGLESSLGIQCPN